jgi:8-oxo-dGTP diphosphatase
MDDSHKNFIGMVAQKAIVERSGKVLLTKGVGDGDCWEIPGGRLHEGEAPIEGLRRELKEELGIEVDVVAMVYSEQFIHTRSQQNHLLLAYHVTIKDSATLSPDATEVEEMKWIDKSNLYEQKIYDNCLHALEFFFEMQR